MTAINELTGLLPEREMILDHLSDNVVIQDLSHTILWANSAVCNSLDLERSEVIGRRCFDIWGNGSGVCPDCPTGKCVETGQPAFNEQTSADGRIWRVRSSPLRDAGGEITSVLKVSEDITEFKRNRQAQRETERHQKLILETMQEMLVYFDRDLKIQWLNQAAARSIGYQAEEIVGRFCYEIRQKRESPCDDCPVQQAMVTGRPQEGEMQGPRGQIHHVRAIRFMMSRAN